MIGIKKQLKNKQSRKETLYQVDMRGEENKPIIVFQSKDGGTLKGGANKQKIGTVKVDDKNKNWFITAQLIIKRENIKIIGYGRKGEEEINWIDRIRVNNAFEKELEEVVEGYKLSSTKIYSS